MSKRLLIVNADDFGQSNGINRGIIKAHQDGIVTSVSLMVRWEASSKAADYCRLHPELSAGLHVDFGEWAFRDEKWVPLYTVASLEEPSAIFEEISKQLSIFTRLTGKTPTHLDSHQHIHHREPARSIFAEIARNLKIPLRNSSDIHYRGEFYGQTAEGAPLVNELTVERLIELLSQLPPGISELGCHPAEEVDIDTMYGLERVKELEVLCDPRIRKAVSEMGVELCTFHNLPGAMKQ